VTKEALLQVSLSFLRDSYAARQVVHAFAEDGGNLTKLAHIIKFHALVLASQKIPRAYGAAQKRRDRALADFENAARRLLAFYDAPEHTYAWMAVYLNVCREGLTVAENTEADRREGRPASVTDRSKHAARIRAALDPLLRDRAFQSRPEKRAPHRPSTHAGLLEVLRKLGLSKADALTILGAIK
jgi:hypothetical protein